MSAPGREVDRGPQRLGEVGDVSEEPQQPVEQRVEQDGRRARERGERVEEQVRAAREQHEPQRAEQHEDGQRPQPAAGGGRELAGSPAGRRRLDDGAGGADVAAERAPGDERQQQHREREPPRPQPHAVDGRVERDERVGAEEGAERHAAERPYGEREQHEEQPEEAELEDAPEPVDAVGGRCLACRHHALCFSMVSLSRSATPRPCSAARVT